MKINSNLEPQGSHAAGGAGSASPTGGAQGSWPAQTYQTDGSDKTEFSSEAQTLAKLSSQMGSVPDVRQDRVATLRQAIQNGTYSVSNEQIAQSMLRDMDK